MAASGIGSRRTCEEWIKQGLVKVNGVVVTELGTRVDPANDKVMFRSRMIRPPLRNYYIAVNKPAGVVCTLADSHAARIITDLVDIQGKPMLRPVGRLDAETEGLIFLSDDGGFINRLTHPRYHVPKTYKARVRGHISPAGLQALRDGVLLSDGMTAPARQVILRNTSRESGDDAFSDVTLTISEGRNRQVRRMFATIGHTVIHLERSQIGPIRLTGIPTGAWRHLTQHEIEMLTDTKSETEKPTEKKETWQIEQQHSTQAKAQSRLSSPRTRRPGPPRTSSNSYKKGSTTG